MHIIGVRVFLAAYTGKYDFRCLSAKTKAMLLRLPTLAHLPPVSRKLRLEVATTPDAPAFANVVHLTACSPRRTRRRNNRGTGRPSTRLSNASWLPSWGPRKAGRRGARLGAESARPTCLRWSTAVQPACRLLLHFGQQDGVRSIPWFALMATEPTGKPRVNVTAY